MSDDLRAAERLRGLVGCTAIDFENASRDCVADMWLLSSAYLAEHPADDGEAHDPPWLIAVGFAQPQGGFPGTLQLGNLRHSTLSRAWFLVRPCLERIPTVLQPKTRGDVRRLAAALGITLKETTDG